MGGGGGGGKRRGGDAGFPRPPWALGWSLRGLIWCLCRVTHTAPRPFPQAEAQRSTPAEAGAAGAATAAVEGAASSEIGAP